MLHATEVFVLLRAPALGPSSVLSPFNSRSFPLFVPDAVVRRSSACYPSLRYPSRLGLRLIFVRSFVTDADDG